MSKQLKTLGRDSSRAEIQGERYSNYGSIVLNLERFPHIYWIALSGRNAFRHSVQGDTITPGGVGLSGL